MDNKNFIPATPSDQPIGAEFSPLPMPGQNDKNPIEIIDLGPSSNSNLASDQSEKSTAKTRERNLGSAALSAKIEELKAAEHQVLSGGDPKVFTSIVMKNREFNAIANQTEQGKAA